ncbi:hypothetical protein N0V93_005342 [Gnomoniopsis smithogilvyi]|uniref:GH64 domain-containing protein n=1 Tax=Gnomoniopsis smithogilvyi TaxID=1191159 RepID=A0A9W8YWE4_9PEZI|nr:hypothetical protein N0V93_005342 [Gnomoniopsis smithogilvyi]
MTTTVDDVCDKQRQEFVLQAPIVPSSATSSSTTSTGTSNGIQSGTTTNTTMSVALVNNTSSSNVYAYITGLASDNNSAVFLLESDGETVYYPTSPSSTGTALSADCAIALGAPGSTTTVTIPRTAGGRIWFAVDATLTFLLNPGPALVEPSVTNESDPNYDIYWDFCEFTFNTAELYINISYVDFVSLPIGLQLENTSGTITTVEGLPATGLDTVCDGLRAQTATDGAGWSDLIIQNSSGANLRALSPNSGITMNSSLFSDYFDSYVQQVWAKYGGGTGLVIDTQASWGSTNGTVSDNILSFGSSVGSFSVPSSADIFSCSSGPFATSTDEMGAIGARLAAAFNRSTLLLDSDQPGDALVAEYYTNPITNHYARLMHATYLDGKGYAFPYDDVAPTGGADQSGSLFDPNPKLLTVTVGGPSATTTAVKLRDMAIRGGQRPGGRRQANHQRIRRDLAWDSAEDEKQMLALAHDRVGEEQDYNSAEADLEKGLGRSQQELSANGGLESKSKEIGALASRPPLVSRPLASLVPSRWADKASSLLARLEASPVYAKARPMIELVIRMFSVFASMSVRALVSRITMALFLVLFYFVMPLISRGSGGLPAPIGLRPGAIDVGMADAVNVTSMLANETYSQ